MMPGVVAGFPRKASPAGITIVAAYDGANFGGYVLDYFGPGASLGSIYPPGASAIPGGPTVVGGPGEILAVWYEQFPGERWLNIEVRGNYSSPPFSGLRVDGAAALTGWFASGTGSSSQNFSISGLTSNPIPAGSHALEFV